MFAEAVETLFLESEKERPMTVLILAEIKALSTQESWFFAGLRKFLVEQTSPYQ